MRPEAAPAVAVRTPLAGVGVLVTRPARQAGGFARKIAALGGVPVIFPAIAILPPEDPTELVRAQAALASYSFAVFVSANAVEHGAPDPARWPRDLPAFAPGPGTAEALAAVGIANARIPSTTFDSAGLLALPEFADPRGKRVLIFRGEKGREELGDALAARGAIVEHVACYRRAPPESGVAGLIEAFADGRIDAVTITSSEGQNNLWSLLDKTTRATWRALPTFVSHPRIAVHVRESGLAAVETPAGDDGLVRGLVEWFARHPKAGAPKI